jgi:hypothetical protein
MKRRNLLAACAVCSVSAVTHAAEEKRNGLDESRLRAGTDLAGIYNSLLEKGKGFSRKGAESLPKVVIVSDTQCPWCTRLWNTIKPLADKADFIWFPVAVLNDHSVTQGAAILSSPVPWETMDRHEMHFKDEGFRGLNTDEMIIPQKDRDAVWNNSKIFRRNGGSVVPLGVVKTKDGRYKVFLSGVTTEELAGLIKDAQ